MKKNVGIKKANSLVFFVLKLFIRPFLFIKYRFKFDTKSSKKIKRPCLILANHTTVIDQFGLSMGFNFGINYVATETLFRHGFWSKLMVAVVRPIPYNKGSSDIIAVRNMFSVIQQGGSVAMFPSGNRSFFGDECKIVSGIGKLVKRLSVPLVLVQFRGGFNTIPRWKRKNNRGKMIGTVVNIIEKDELSKLTNEEVDDIIQKALNFNEFDYNSKVQIKFKGKHRAEYLESVLFYCPQCDCMTGLYSHGNDFICKNCKMQVSINETGFFDKVNNADKIPNTVLEWSKLQLEYIKKFDFSPYKNKPLFYDENVQFSKGERAKKEHFLANGKIELYEDKIKVCDKDFYLHEITLTIQGVRKLTIYKDEEVYAVLTPYRINTTKYMICGYHLRNKKLDIKEDYYGY